MSKKLLIIVASDDIENFEIANISSQANLYGIVVHLERVNSYGDLYVALCKGVRFDYIYLASHGCEDYFGNISGTMKVTWSQFSMLICYSAVPNKGAIFFHSCCRGGAAQVAFQMFSSCELIDYVCGPRHLLKSVDLITAFNLFLYFIEVKKIDAVRSAEKVLSATDIRLICFDQVEVAMDLSYENHKIKNEALVAQSWLDIVAYEVERDGGLIGTITFQKENYKCLYLEVPFSQVIISNDTNTIAKLYEKNNIGWQIIEGSLPNQTFFIDEIKKLVSKHQLDTATI
jgi:hypothetical protein